MITKQPLSAAFPIARPRRLRRTAPLRRMVRETRITPDDFIVPLFVSHGQAVQKPITSMPGQFQWSVDKLSREAETIAALRIPAVILFGIPSEKDPVGLENFAPDGIIQQATRALKDAVPDLVVITDVCLCEYTDHGHCGLLNNDRAARSHPRLDQGYALNDETLEIMGRAAVSHAEAGADVVAPSAMMDGMVRAIRIALDGHDFAHIPILSYAVKYASALYSPFREAVHGGPKFGDRKTYQMDSANAREALREATLDVEEGADMLMVKPALSYLDIVRQIRDRFPEVPLAAYSVSGEYAMIKAAAAKGWIDEKAVVLELLTGIKRSGADLILTYHAKDAARWLEDR